MKCLFSALSSHARSLTRSASVAFVTASPVILASAAMTTGCAMGDSGSIDFVSTPTKKDPKAPKPCAGDGECTLPAPYCDVVTQTCIQCLANPNCAGPKAFCSSSGACVECIDDAGCAKAKPFCDLSRNTCVECLAEGQCDAAKTCDTTQRRCVPTCVDNSQCSAMTPYCDVARRFCVECTADPNCADMKKPVCLSSSGACVECSSSVHCAPEKPICDIIANKCVVCASNAECPLGQKCDPMGRCAP